MKEKVGNSKRYGCKGEDVACNQENVCKLSFNGANVLFLKQNIVCFFAVYVAWWL